MKYTVNILELENYPDSYKRRKCEKYYTFERSSSFFFSLAMLKITITIVIAAKLLIYHDLTLKIRVIHTECIAK